MASHLVGTFFIEAENISVLLSPVVVQEGTERNFINEDVDQRVGALTNLKQSYKLSL